jgi:hypothetical protein
MAWLIAYLIVSALLTVVFLAALRAGGRSDRHD